MKQDFQDVENQASWESGCLNTCIPFFKHCISVVRASVWSRLSSFAYCLFKFKHTPNLENIMAFQNFQEYCLTLQVT